MKSQLFNYKEDFSFGVFTPAFAFFGLMIYSYFYQSGVQFKNPQELAHSNSLYILGIIGLVFLFNAIQHYRKFGASKRNIQLIELQGSSFSFPEGASKVIHVSYKDVHEFSIKKLLDDGESVLLHTENQTKKHEFYNYNFDSPAAYNLFKETMMNYCSHLDSKPEYVLS